MWLPHVPGLQRAAGVRPAAKPALVALPDAAPWKIPQGLSAALWRSSVSSLEVASTVHLGTCRFRGRSLGGQRPGRTIRLAPSRLPHRCLYYHRYRAEAGPQPIWGPERLLLSHGFRLRPSAVLRGASAGVDRDRGDGILAEFFARGEAQWSAHRHCERAHFRPILARLPATALVAAQCPPANRSVPRANGRG